MEIKGMKNIPDEELISRCRASLRNMKEAENQMEKIHKSKKEYLRKRRALKEKKNIYNQYTDERKRRAAHGIKRLWMPFDVE